MSCCAVQQYRFLASYSVRAGTYRTVYYAVGATPCGRSVRTAACTASRHCNVLLQPTSSRGGGYMLSCVRTVLQA